MGYVTPHLYSSVGSYDHVWYSPTVFSLQLTFYSILCDVCLGWYFYSIHLSKTLALPSGEGVSTAYSRDSSRFPRRVHNFYRQPPSRQAQVHRVTQLLTDGVPCRESAGAGSVVLKVVPITGAAFSGITMDQFFLRLSFPTPTSGTVDTCAT